MGKDPYANVDNVVDCYNLRVVAIDMERLQKIISTAGIASRRAAEKMIGEGRVTVDGQKIIQMGFLADPAVNKICVDGRSISAKEPFVYFMLYKPRGYISTAKDERGRRTVVELLPEVSERIYPVGRLDSDTEGLLLMTNDGTLMNALLHPRNEINKIYVVQVEGDITPASGCALRRGVTLADGRTAPAKVKILDRDVKRGRTKLEMIIHEGRNRQVRRMCEAVGFPVHRLKRVGFAGLSLEGLRRGAFRPLREEEVSYLYRLTGAKNIANKARPI